MVIGGTSAVAPLWAGLIALANQQNSKTAGFINPAIYVARAKAAFRDITKGNNGAFKANSGWDACTGLGSPVAPQLISAVNPAGTRAKGKAGKGKVKKAAAKTGKKHSASSAKKLPGKKKPPTLAQARKE
jgi:kumamolisin